jgi:amidase
MNVLAKRSLKEQRTPHDYTTFLNARGLRRARIGIERRLFQPEFFAPPPEILAVIEETIEAMGRAGATIIDPVDTGDPFAWYDAETTVLLYEFKHDIEQYLRGLRRTSKRTLGDLIRFNIQYCRDEMKYFGQELFELAEATGGDLSDPVYLEAHALALRLARDEGIDRVMRRHNLDVVLSPSYGFGSSAPAVAGYPVISVPVGLASDGKPAGVWLYAGFLQEPKLLAVAYGIERLVGARAQPQFLASPPPEPPDAGICNGPIVAQGQALTMAQERRRKSMHLGHPMRW